MAQKDLAERDGGRWPAGQGCPPRGHRRPPREDLGFREGQVLGSRHQPCSPAPRLRTLGADRLTKCQVSPRLPATAPAAGGSPRAAPAVPAPPGVWEGASRGRGSRLAGRCLASPPGPVRRSRLWGDPLGLAPKKGTPTGQQRGGGRRSPPDEERGHAGAQSCVEAPAPAGQGMGLGPGLVPARAAATESWGPGWPQADTGQQHRDPMPVVGGRCSCRAAGCGAPHGEPPWSK